MIETLAAILILALVTGFWFEALATTSQHQRAMIARADATLVAASQLATVGVIDAVAPGTHTGRDGSYDWQIAIESFDGSDSLAQVTVTVRRDGGPVLATLTSLRLRS